MMPQKSYQEEMKKSKNIDLKNKNFSKIFQFYVIDTPCYSDKNHPQNLISAKGVSFKDYGWDQGYKFNQLKNLMINVNANRKIDLIQCDNKVNSLADNKYPPDEYCIYNADQGKINSIFYKIRNALAHGEFSLIKYTQKRENKENESLNIYFLTNHHKGLKAEMALSEQTLLKWIAIIKNGPETTKETKK